MSRDTLARNRPVKVTNEIRFKRHRLLIAFVSVIYSFVARHLDKKK